MHTKVYPVSLIVLGLLFLQVGCVSPPSTAPRLRPTEAFAELSLLVIADQAVPRSEKGEVQVIRKGQMLAPVYVGLAIEPGDQVQTTENAEAVFDLKPGGRVYVGNSTRITFSSLTVWVGEVWVSLNDFFYRVRGYFDLEATDTKVIATGTDFYVSVRDDGLTYLVLDGRILVTNKLRGPWQAFYMEPGQKVILVRGQPPQGPVAADAQEVESLLRWKVRLDKMIPLSPPPRIAVPPVSPRPVGVAVPSVIGKDEKEAAVLLNKNGLRKGTITTKATGRARPGLIVDQRPRAGEVVARNTRVNLVVEAQPPSRVVAVPSVIGRDEKTAAGILARSGLRAGRVTPRTTGRAKPGTILDQRPPAGTAIARNTTVDLVVAEAPRRVTVRVPSITGKDEKQAAAILKQYDLRVGRIITRATGRAKPGTIIEQRPGKGEVVARNTRVNLVVEAQPPSRVVAVPSVIGRSQDQAAAILKRYGLRTGGITTRRTGRARPGTVIDQRPRKGERVDRNAAVALVVEAATVQEIKTVVTSIDTIIRIQNTVFKYIGSAIQDISRKKYSASEQSIKRARSEFRRTDLPYQDIVKRQTRVEFKRLYEVARALRATQDHMLRLLVSMIAQARRNDTGGYNSSARKFKGLRSAYSKKVDEGNKILQGLRRKVVK